MKEKISHTFCSGATDEANKNKINGDTMHSLVLTHKVCIKILVCFVLGCFFFLSSSIVHVPTKSANFDRTRVGLHPAPD